MFIYVFSYLVIYKIYYGILYGIKLKQYRFYESDTVINIKKITKPFTATEIKKTKTKDKE